MKGNFKQILNVLWVIGTCVLMASCKSNNTSIPKTDNTVLNHLLNSKPLTIINLKNKSIDSLFAKKQNIIGKKSADSVASPVVFGSILGLIKMDNHLYAADRRQHRVWILNKGIVVGTKGRQGRGPGEFGNLTGILRNSNHIFTIDNTNGRLQKYNRQFHLIATFHHIIYGNALTGNKSITATDSLLYLPSGASSHTKLIEIHRSESPFDSVKAILPRLIPPAKQPAAYNGFLIDGNSEGKVAVSYVGLPYIFIYNRDAKLQHVIYLKFPTKMLPDNPSAAPKTKNKALGVEDLITQLSITNDNNIYFFGGKYFYQLSPNEVDTGYQLQKVRFFTFKDSEERKENPNGLTPTTMTITNGTIYMTSIFAKYIYRFPLK